MDPFYIVITNDVDDSRRVSYTKHRTYEAAMEEVRQPARNSRVIKYLTKVEARREGHGEIEETLDPASLIPTAQTTVG